MDNDDGEECSECNGTSWTSAGVLLVLLTYAHCFSLNLKMMMMIASYLNGKRVSIGGVLFEKWKEGCEVRLFKPENLRIAFDFPSEDWQIMILLHIHNIEDKIYKMIVGARANQMGLHILC